MADFIARSERSDEQSVANDELSRYSGILGTNVVGTYEALGVPDWAVVTEIPWQIAYRGVINIDKQSSDLAVEKSCCTGEYSYSVRIRP